MPKPKGMLDGNQVVDYLKNVSGSYEEISENDLHGVRLIKELVHRHITNPEKKQYSLNIFRELGIPKNFFVSCSHASTWPPVRINTWPLDC